MTQGGKSVALIGLATTLLMAACDASEPTATPTNAPAFEQLTLPSVVLDPPPDEVTVLPPTPTHPPSPRPSPTTDPACATMEVNYEPTVETSSLMEVLELLPMSIKEEGVWYGDLQRALVEAGAPMPRSLQEFACLDQAEADKVIAASEGMVGVYSTGIAARMRSYIDRWPEVFGLDFFEVSLQATAGYLPPFGPNYIEGDFDVDLVKSKLLELGYQEVAHAGSTYYTIREDHDRDPRHPGGRLGLGSMNRVYITDHTLITSPYTEFMTQVLEIMAGTGPSLADAPAFSSLALALDDPLSAVLLDRQSVLEQADQDPTEYERPPEWGTMHEWKALGMGFDRMESGQPRHSISLFYDDPGHAAEDEDELLLRMGTYEPPVFEDLKTTAAGSTLADVCETLTSVVSSEEDGSTLAVFCHNPSSLVFWTSVGFGIALDPTIFLP